MNDTEIPETPENLWIFSSIPPLQPISQECHISMRLDNDSLLSFPEVDDLNSGRGLGIPSECGGRYAQLAKLVQYGATYTLLAKMSS